MCANISCFRETHTDACGAVFIQCVSETRSRVDPHKIPRELREPQNARPPGTFTVNVPRRVVPVVARKGNDPEELKVSALECHWCTSFLAHVSWKVYFLCARASKREEVCWRIYLQHPKACTFLAQYVRVNRIFANAIYRRNREIMKNVN